MKFFGSILKKITNLKASTSALKKFFNSIFKNNNDSTKKLNPGTSTTIEYPTVTDNLKDCINNMSELVNKLSGGRYNTISGENQLLGNLFPKLINETNEIIEEANKNRKEYINNFE